MYYKPFLIHFKEHCILEKVKQIGIGVLGVLAIVVLLDFVIPGKEHIETVQLSKGKREQYYNAAQNQHYSYAVTTNARRFNASTTFAKSLSEGDQVEIISSRLLNKVNYYQKVNGPEGGVYSLRIFTGLIIPLFFMIVAPWSKKRNIDTLLFVACIAMLANVVFVLV